MLSANYVCCIYSNELQTNFNMNTNTMNPIRLLLLFGSSLTWVHIVYNIGYQTT